MTNEKQETKIWETHTCQCAVYLLQQLAITRLEGMEVLQNKQDNFHASNSKEYMYKVTISGISKFPYTTIIPGTGSEKNRTAIF